MSTVSQLLTVGNPKTAKGEGLGYLTAILHLSPVRLAGRGNVCPHASAGCRAACLNTAGRGGIIKSGASTNAIQEARKRRTRLFFDERGLFKGALLRDVARHVVRAQRHGLKPAVRLNGTSDIAWEKVLPEVFSVFPEVWFYDYTKDERRMMRSLCEGWPSNYHLTFSRSESNAAACVRVLGAGGNVAAVFDQRIPLAWKGRPVLDGDTYDLRFLEGHQGAWIGLKAKGKARKDTSGFVVRLAVR